MPNALHYAAYQTALIDAGEVRKALTIVNTMAENDVAPDVNVYTNLVKCAGKAGLINRIPSILEEMKRAGITPNYVTFVTHVRALLEANRSQECLTLLAKGATKRMHPHHGLVKDVVSKLAAENDAERVLEFLPRLLHSSRFDAEKDIFELCAVVDQV